MIWFVDGMVDGTDYPDFLIDCSLLHVYINIVYFPFYIFRYLDKYGYPLQSVAGDHDNDPAYVQVGGPDTAGHWQHVCIV